ncbi:hypothetical protein C8A01DRAFT_16463 [Parachaetomium inaequale]|uniref:Ribosomal RNA methyltransferase FtsJ domain-containing protein n=1 Tax=Parachaetomium inaequale TaxID=2588326 RepID=A0AAN6PID7_9PEZI|nr:hypothetical protein C8A01DRAFT_16463 [Parachaetomium inaequale]
MSSHSAGAVLNQIPSPNRTLFSSAHLRVGTQEVNSMGEISECKASPGPANNSNATPRVQPKTLLQEYLLEHLPIYRKLRELQRLGWQSEAGDTHFQNQRQRADHADAKAKTGFFRLMRTIGLELDDATLALTLPSGGNSPRPAILDLCMAPGGFSSAALYRNPAALLRGISLPPSQGGHEMLLNKYWSDRDPSAQIYVSFRDITLLAEEMGTPASSVPASHPDAASFSSDRPFMDQEFDLVFCDGQVLRTHERLEYRQKTEATRLLTTQLVLALQRIRPGGTIVILLHKADAWPSVQLMHTFAAFADGVELFKPRAGHRVRSSFYLVAKGVRPWREAAVEAVRRWKVQWSVATFGVQGGRGDERLSGEEELELLEGGEEEEVRAVLRKFGPALVRMVEPVFAIQAEALRNAPWMKNMV